MKYIHYLAAALLASAMQAAHAAPVEITQILQSTEAWTQAPLPGFTAGQTDLRVVTFKIQPGAKTSIHLHPVNGAGYVVSGELTMVATEDTTGDFSDPKKVKTIVLKTGEAWTEAVNTWHYGINNGKEDVTFIVVFAATEGTPSSMSLQSFKLE